MIIEPGMVRAMIRLARQRRRKTTTTRMTSRPPMKMLWYRFESMVSMKRAASKISMKRTSRVSSRSSSAILALTAVATCTVFAPDCFCTKTTATGVPSRRATLRMSLWASTTSATSSSATGAEGVPPTISSAISEMLRYSAGMRTGRS